MPNWCHNNVLIRGPEDEIRRYKDSLLRDSAGKYYPLFKMGPLPELKGKDEFSKYIHKESNRENLHYLHYRAAYLEVTENSPEELELSFSTAYSQADNLGPEELCRKLAIFHEYFEAINNFHGFVYIVKGKVIAKGCMEEEGREEEFFWKIYFDFNPWPEVADPLIEKLKDRIVIPINKLQPLEKLIELCKKKESV
jgi:hypothetical protein